MISALTSGCVNSKQAYMDRLWGDIVRFASEKETEWMAEAMLGDYNAKLNLGYPQARADI